MLVGVGIFGLLAASLASFFLERNLEQSQEQVRQEDNSQLAEIAARLERIEQLLASSGASAPLHNPLADRSREGSDD